MRFDPENTPNVTKCLVNGRERKDVVWIDTESETFGHHELDASGKSVIEGNSVKVVEEKLTSFRLEFGNSI